MKEGPSQPARRSRLQTTASCCYPMAVVVNVTEKAQLRLSHVLVRGTNAGEPLMRPRNRSTGDIKTGALPLSGNKYGGNLITGHAVSGVKVAQWRDSSLGTDMELENRVGGDKGKGTSGTPRVRNYRNAR